MIEGLSHITFMVRDLDSESLPTQTYNHVAFKFSDTDYPACLERVRSLGLDVREGRSRVEGEGRIRVRSWGGSNAIQVNETRDSLVIKNPSSAHRSQVYAGCVNLPACGHRLP